MSWFGDWWRQRSLRRQAQRLIRDLFGSPERLRESSLRPDQYGRADLKRFETDASGSQVTVIYFGMIRHPRPYAFSRQAHHVYELYRYECETGVITVHDSVNLTRERGRDSD